MSETTTTTVRRRRAPKTTVVGEVVGEEVKANFIQPEGEPTPAGPEPAEPEPTSAEPEPTEEQAAPVTRRKRGGGTAVVAGAKAGPAAPKELAPIAKEINVRLGKAEKLESDAHDHRLAAAIKLAEAEEICKRAGVGFKAWAEANVKSGDGNLLTYGAVRKLLYIGRADNPEEELERQREAQAERAKASREKKAAEVAELKKAAAAKPEAAEEEPEAEEEPAAEEPVVAKEQDVTAQIDKLFQRLDAEQQTEFMVSVFDYLDAKEQKALVTTLADMIGGKLVFDH